MIELAGAYRMMNHLENEMYPARRFRIAVARLIILIIILVVLGLLSHPTAPVNRAVWKSSPYGDPRGTEIMKAGH